MKALLGRMLLIGFVTLLASQAWAEEGEWGTLRGKFVFDGKAPEQKPVNVAKEPFCTKCNVRTEDAVVDQQTNAVANVVVFLKAKKGEKITIHPDYETPEAKNAEVVIDNKDCRFSPHVVFARVGQPVVVKNSDPVGHNSNITPLNDKNKAFNQILPAGASAKYSFKAAESLAVSVACNIHPWMKALVIVRDDPYAAVSQPDGTFEIKNLPVGTFDFQVRHDSGYVTKPTVNGKAVEWKRGIAELPIKPGDNDLGEIKIKF
jgi:plastocyanin